MYAFILLKGFPADYLCKTAYSITKINYPREVIISRKGTKLCYSLRKKGCIKCRKTRMTGCPVRWDRELNNKRFRLDEGKETSLSFTVSLYVSFSTNDFPMWKLIDIIFFSRDESIQYLYFYWYISPFLFRMPHYDNVHHSYYKSVKFTFNYHSSCKRWTRVVFVIFSFSPCICVIVVVWQ